MGDGYIRTKREQGIHMTDDSRLPRYTPAVPPLDTEHMPLYIQRNLQQIAVHLNRVIRQMELLKEQFPDIEWEAREKQIRTQK